MRLEQEFGIRLCVAAFCVAAASPAPAQLAGPGGVLSDPLGRGPGGIAGPIGERVGGTVDRLGDIVEEAGEEIDERTESIGQGVANAVDDIERLAAAATEIFRTGEDEAGQPVERDIWVVLVPNEFSDRIPGWGFVIREQRDLEGLDLVMLRVEAPDDRSMSQTEQDLGQDAPGTVVDFNHIYAPSQQDPAGPLTGRLPAESTSRPVELPPNAITLGLIDSAIAAHHPAFAEVTIVQTDFVPFQGERPREHGTAVASIALDAMKARSASRPIGLIAASVFFVNEGNEQTATTGSLVAALEWLGQRQVGVINMSLTGPPNRVLEAALAAIDRRGIVVVAAVGNEGPAGEPLFPAAYDSVLGITAVDKDQRIYRRANRGPQVAFSALGVRVRAARPAGDFHRETGTSMAAPIAAAVIVSAMAADGSGADVVLRRLEREAIDLGPAGIDDVYGHGLISPVE